MASVLLKEKLQNKKVAHAFNNFFLKSNLHHVEKDALSFLKDSFPGILPSIKIIPTTEVQIKNGCTDDI
jgi:hypothetical protein